MFDRGVVTLCDAAYYPGLLALHASIHDLDPVPIVCYDIGLTPEQREDAGRRADLHVLDLPPDPLIARLQRATADAAPLQKAVKRIWPLWICPVLIAAAPIGDVAWLDADLLVLRPIRELFALLEGGPVFTPENRAPHLSANAAELYDLLPVALPFDRTGPAINGGVSVWRRGRDDDALAAYIHPVAAAADDARVRAAIAWHDQGALLWAIHALGLQSRVLADTRWNLCVDNAGLTPEDLHWDDGLAARLRAALPDVGIVHWNGRQVPWAG